MAYIKSRKHAVARALPPLTHAAAAFALSLPVAAQTQNPHADTLKEVRVEGSANTEFKVDQSANPKFTAPLLDTPQTISVIPETLYKEQAASTLTEALRNSPGVSTFYLGENGNTSTGDAIYMRGYDSSSSIFVDGIRDMGSYSRDLFNISQVEVVKGPASTDVGRTSPTGYVNMISKKPQTSDSFAGTVGFGSGDYKRGTIDWNKSLSSDNGIGAVFRLNAVAEDSGVAGRDEIKNKRWGIAPSLALGLNSPTRWYFDYLHLDQNNVPDGGVPTVGLPGYSSPDPQRAFLNFAQPVDPSNFYGTTSDFDKVKTDMFTARVEHDITPDMTIRNTFRYGKTAQDYLLTSFMGSSANLLTPSALQPSTWTLARNLPTNKDQSNTIYADQLNLSARFNTGSLSHAVNTGIEINREEQKTLGYYGANATVFGVPGVSNSGAWPAANLYDPNPNVTGYQRIPNGTGTEGATTTIGVYAFDTVKLNPQWELSGGLRFDHYSTDYNATTLNATTGVITPTSLSVGGNLWSGKLGLVYKPAENGSLYAAYGTGAQPPGGSNFSLAASGTGNNANRTDFNPQRTETMELGTKWDVLNHQLALTAALFRTDISNQVIPTDATNTSYIQAGKQRVQGIELGAVGNITRDLALSAGFTSQDTKIVNGPTLTADGTSVLAYTPKTAFTSWLTYRLPVNLTLGLGARYVGQLHRGTDSAIGTPKFVESYWVWDAMASYAINKNLDLQLNLYNLFDKDYVAAINKSGYRYTPGIPRSARLTLNFTF